MNAANGIGGLVDELAAHWTDAALEMLKASGVWSSVPIELATWHALKEELQSKLARQQVMGLARLPVEVIMRQVVLRALLWLARGLALGIDTHDLENQLRLWIGRQKLKAAEHVLYGQIVAGPVTRVAARLSRRLAYFPRISAISG